MGGLDYDAIIAAHDASEALTSQAMGVTAHIETKSVHDDPVTSPNVVGVLEGSDPKLKNEYIILNAHSDHVGVAKGDHSHGDEGEQTDKIYNGALDNASGVTTLLEVARMFKESGVRPKRSILFAAVTAEEKGLLGSEYLAKNPVVPIKQIVANVNLDMPILTYDAVNLVAFGVEHSTMDKAIKKGVEAEGFNLIPDPVPAMNIFSRSDQFSFVKEGVPAVFLFMDLTAEGGEGQVGAKMFMEKHYHKVSDDLNLPIDYNLAARFVKANYEIAKNLANQKEAPRWKDESFFKSIDKR
jgi:Zn-dependent M28 family amino/carboxypeptidase